MSQVSWVFDTWQWIVGHPEVVFSGIGITLTGVGARIAKGLWRRYRASTENSSTIFFESNIVGEYYTYRWSATRKLTNEHSLIKGRVVISARLHKRKFNVKYSDDDGYAATGQLLAKKNCLYGEVSDAPHHEGVFFVMRRPTRQFAFFHGVIASTDMDYSPIALKTVWSKRSLNQAQVIEHIGKHSMLRADSRKSEQMNLPERLN